MKVSCRLIVREVKLISKNSKGASLSRPFHVLFAMDRDTGGDIQLVNDTGLFEKLGLLDYQFDGVVRGRLVGYDVKYSVTEGTFKSV